jgi:NitT/TauT family transport system permease protein
VLVALYSIPKITLYPIVLLAFGIGMPAKIAFGAIHGIMPIAIFAMARCATSIPFTSSTARVMRLPPLRIASRVLLPAAIPEIFTGIRIGFSLTLIGTLLGEMFASQRGIGHLLMQAIGLHNVRMIMALTLLLVVIAVTASALLLAIDREVVVLCDEALRTLRRQAPCRSSSTAPRTASSSRCRSPVSPRQPIAANRGLAHEARGQSFSKNA